MRIWRYLHEFWQSEDAQDLIEYTLIVASVVLICIGFISILTPNTKLIWANDSTMLSQAQSVATH